MLSVHHISKSYNLISVLKDVSFTLNRGERLGLVGPNGCGKTTLLRILAGDESADTGHYQLASGVQVGYLAQGFLPNENESLLCFLSGGGGDLAAVSAEVERLASELELCPEDEVLHQAYDAALAQLVAATEVAKRSGGVLAAFGLDSLPENTRIGTLSGGQKTRLALARILLSNPDLLLLDEPSNHLDQEMLIWLEGWLATFPGGVLVASHDRIFLDRATNGTLELDAHTHSVRRYAGGYSDYLEQKQAELDRHWQEYQDQNEEIARLRATAAHLRGLARFRRGGKADSGDKFARGFFANRGAETMGRAKQIEARLERLLTDERIEKPRPDWQMKIEFGETTESGRDVIVMDNLSVGYGDHVLISGINLHLRYRARTVLSGPNGCGKTTLLRTIAGHLSPLAGSVRLGSRVKVGYMTQEQENLDPQANAFSALRRIFSQSETEVRSFLSKFLFVGDDVFVPAGELSYGERARLALALLVAEGCNLLLLDEPINHLDIPSRTRFEKALSTFEGSILAVVHDRYFIQGFAKQIWEARDGRVVEP